MNFLSYHQRVVVLYLLLKVSFIPILLFPLPCLCSMAAVLSVYLFYNLLEIYAQFLTVLDVFFLPNLLYGCC